MKAGVTRYSRMPARWEGQQAAQSGADWKGARLLTEESEREYSSFDSSLECCWNCRDGARDSEG